MICIANTRRDNQIYSKYELSSNRNPKIRSKTFHGIAVAMANQWTNIQYEQLTLEL